MLHHHSEVSQNDQGVFQCLAQNYDKNVLHLVGSCHCKIDQDPQPLSQ